MQLTRDRHSVWVFLLLGIEAIRTYKTNPSLVIGTHHVPTWTTPLMLCLVVSALVPSSSMLGHLCGLAVGYLCRPTPFLPITCPIYHWLTMGTRSRPGVPQVPCAAGEGPAVGGGEAQPAGQAAALRQRGPKDVRPLRRPAQREQPQRNRPDRDGYQHAEVGSVMFRLLLRRQRCDLVGTRASFADGEWIRTDAHRYSMAGVLRVGIISLGHGTWESCKRVL